MPRNKNSEEPPKAITWKKAFLVLVVAALFDLMRLFFMMFWFFGPAIAAVYCTSKTVTWVGSLWGLTAAACTAGAAVAGVAASAMTIAIGIIMADAVGLAGFLVLGLWVAMSNARLLKTISTAKPQFIAAFAIGEIPLVGSLPVFTFVLWKLYRAQIKTEGAALKKWEQEHTDAQRRERQEQAAMLMQARNARIAQAQNQGVANYEEFEEEAANDEQYDEISENTRKPAYAINSAAANDDSYIPQDMDRAA
jgi:hypothetical protein